MADHPNNHNRERTQTVLREEVEKALGNNVPAKRVQDVVTRVGQIVDKYSSPYPDSEWLTQVEILAPGCTRDIVAASIDDLRSRRELEEKALALKDKELGLIQSIADGERSSTSQGRYVGFSAYLVAYIFSGIMYYIGAHELAYLGFGAGSLGIIAQLIKGGATNAVTVTAKATKNQLQKAK